MRSEISSAPWVRLALSLALIVCFWPHSAAAGEFVFLLSDGNVPSELFRVDLDTNEATSLLVMGGSTAYHAATICPGRDDLIAIGKIPPVVTAVDLNAAVPAQTELGALPASFNNRVLQLACALDGTLYLTHTGTESLYTLDLLSCPACAPQLVGRIETAPGLADVDVGGADLAITPSGDLFLLTNRTLGMALAPQLYQVDPATALATLIGPVDSAFGFTGLVAVATDRLLASSQDDHLYEVDRTDASLADLGTLTSDGVPLDLLNGDLAAPLPICVCFPVPPTDLQGCSPGYWKNHLDSWPPTGYSPGQSASSVFAGAAAYPDLAAVSLLQALGLGGGPGPEGAARTLLRAAVAAVLNAAHPDVDYPRGAAQVIADTDAALASGERDAMLALALSLDADNNLGCPLNGGNNDESHCRCRGACDSGFEDGFDALNSLNE